MRNNFLFGTTAFIVAMILSAAVAAATANPEAAAVDFKWSARTGLGYDSNAYRAPGASYIDYAPTTPVAVTPRDKSGFFVPYEVKAEVEKSRDQDNKLIGSATLDGSFYTGSGLGNANEYNIDLSGGAEHVLEREGKSEDTFYFGALAGKHKHVYVDHDTGLEKTNTAGTVDISGRYSYVSMGVEADYKHRTGKLDYGFSGQYILNDYADPIVVSQEDHGYLALGADASISVADQTRLNFSLDHSVRDYSRRNSRNAQGTLSAANPLLQYTYDAFGVSLRSRISDQWLVHADFDLTQRADNYVGYNDYDQNRIGGRAMFQQGRFKGRLALHHWSREYPNGFAFDRPIGGAKTYSGNDVKARAEWEQTKSTALWSELVYDVQDSTDLRYDYVRTLVMAGMSWAH